MFKQRLFTTVILIPIVLLAIYFAYPWLLGLVILAIIAVGAWEWTELMPLNGLVRKVFFVIIILGLVWPSINLLSYWVFTSFAAWVLIFIAVITYPDSQAYWGYPIVVGALCVLFLPLFAACITAIYLLPQGKDLIVYLLCLVWAADVGAYLTGKVFGKTKLIPKVSPGKTIEGVAGGFCLTLLVSLIAYFYFLPAKSVLWFSLAACIVLISVLGDLFISILKRRCQVKDTGNVFPGHGGVLDRFDSLIAALPLYVFGLNYIMAAGV